MTGRELLNVLPTPEYKSIKQLEDVPYDRLKYLVDTAKDKGYEHMKLEELEEFEHYLKLRDKLLKEIN